MSAAAVRIFLPTLREVERDLRIPIPDRVRILRELEFDLEEFCDRLVAHGLPADEARIRALEALVPDGTALRELDLLHASLYGRITRRLSGDHLRVLERSALAVATASVLLVQALTLVRANLLRDPSPFLWPVLGLGALLFAAITAKVFELWVKGDHSTPGRGLSGILALAGTTLAAGICGTFVDLYRLAGFLESAPELAATLASQWLVRDSALLSVSILLSLAGGLTWFVLTQWLTLVSVAHRDVLGLGHTIKH